MTYEVTTGPFSGPLDLLLRLVTTRQMEITEVSLGDLVAEYLSYLELAADLDLEITSEFLLIAASLIQLKARRLLPEDGDIDLDEELALAEERDRLLSRLLACLTYKDVAAVIAHRIEATARLTPRFVGLDPGITPNPPDLRFTVAPEGLAAIAAGVINRRKEPDLDHLDLELPSVADAIVAVRRRLTGEMETDFDALIGGLHRPVEVIAYFLAVLELARWGMVEARQQEVGAPITLRSIDVEDDGFVSEWDR